jgi:hypothetical protein
MYQIEPLVPLIGPTVVGPLGVAHLPRMWLKGILSAARALPDTYFDDYKGFNKRVVDALGLEPEPWFAFLKTVPTYLQAESYVKEHAKNLDAATIAAINADIASLPRPEENAAKVREAVGLDVPGFNNSAMLINLDDWCSIHKELLAHKNDGLAPLVPMVSSAETGMLGVPHLPRMWMKAFSRATGALPSDWKSGLECGLDNQFAKLTGMDLAAAIAYINAELPDYLTFERWFEQNVGPVSDAQKAEWAEKIAALQQPEDRAQPNLAEAGAGDIQTRSTVLINDLVDWKYMHDDVAGRKLARA